MPNKELLFKKIQEILKQLSHLKELCALRPEKLFGDESRYYFAERVMERLIGAAIDINMHLVSDLRGETPKDYFSSFTALAELKILPRAFAQRIALSTSLRNILVHEYQSIEPDKFFEALKTALKDYSKYVVYIEKVLR